LDDKLSRKSGATQGYGTEDEQEQTDSDQVGGVET